METRQIKINGHSEIETLKIYILQQLKLIDHKKNNLDEFESKLRGYLQRNRSLEIKFILDNSEFEKDIRFDLGIIKNQAKLYPENYEFGNPLNRWLFDGTEKLANEEIEIEDIKLDRKFEELISKFNIFFDLLEKLGNGKIKIERK